MKKNILGVDPGIINAGYSVLSFDAGRMDLHDLGVFSQKSKDSVGLRISNFHDFIEEKIKIFHVTHVVLETPFLGKNAQNFLKLGYIRGILLMLAHRHQCEILEFSPMEIKKSCTGFGAATKDQVARALGVMFPGLNKISANVRQDATDALAVALSGALSANTSINRLG